jgi:tetratricopeptide (TPR) repeat protein
VGEEVQLWGEGLVDLLSTALDGSGVVSAVDPRAVLVRWRRSLREDEGFGTRAGAASVAADLGSGRMIMGSLIETGPQSVQLTGELFNVRRLSREASVSVQGPESDMLGLVDQLSVELLKSILEEADVPDARVSAVTTTSVPALRAYLEGIQAFRRSGFDEARRAFERAVEEDSTFALAAYGLSRATGWADMDEARAAAILLAARHTAGLPARHRMLIVGRKRMEIDEDPATIGLFENLTLLHPDDFEAWDGLAEALFHHGHEVGYHLDRVVDALDHAYAIDSTAAPAYFHGISSAFILDDDARARAWSRAYLTLDSTSVYAQGLRLALALRLGSPQERETATSAMDTASAEVLSRILWFAPAGRSSLTYVNQVSNAASAPRFPGAERAGALRRLASENRRSGRVVASLELEDEARVLDGRGRDLFALTAMRVAGILGDSLVAAEHDHLAAEAAYPDDAPFLAAHWAGVGRTDEAAVAVSRLERMADSLASQGDTATARERRGSALAYEGHLAAARGDTATAIDRLRRGIAMMRPDWGGPRGLHRFALARLLMDHGGEDEALTIFRALRRPVSLEALSYLQAAVLYERRGEREAALRYYGWSLELWSSADPHFDPWIEAARQGIKRLDAAESGS